MALIERILDACLASDEGGAPRDLFDLLRSARDPETGAAFTREQLRDQVATMIVAGHETTALTYSGRSICSPRARVAGSDRRRDRWLTRPAGGPDALASLVQTRAVVSEALRLYPPAFLMMRVAIKADRAGDLRSHGHRAHDRALGCTGTAAFGAIPMPSIHRVFCPVSRNRRASAISPSAQAPASASARSLRWRRRRWSSPPWFNRSEWLPKIIKW